MRPFDSASIPRQGQGEMIPDLPTFLLLGLKILAALGFMTAANFVMLYAS